MKPTIPTEAELKRRQTEFQRDVQLAVDQLDRGEGIIVEQKHLWAFFDDIQARGRARYEASKKRR
jgi:hypothetical protein